MIRDHGTKRINLASLLAIDLSFVRRAAAEQSAERDRDNAVAAAPPVTGWLERLRVALHRRSRR